MFATALKDLAVELNIFVMSSTQVNANVPLSSMFGYATDLRSKTQGRGQYSMEPSHYSEVPKSVSEKIIGNRQPKE